MKAAMKNKQSTSFADLVADSELAQQFVQVGDHTVTIQEMTGRQRFELSKRADDDRWDTMLWLASISLIDPAPDSIDALEKIKPAWVIKIATAAMALSGMETDAIDEAKNESAVVTDTGGS
jgi:hypothetical protein